ncbi:MAG: hypothetical protein HQ582_22765 [Planctomycetes bacterium]|nr:hypothetical protein [Planctomycetota bacterium]
MHTVELLEEAIALAERTGYKVRQEWLSGGGGCCELKGQKWIFLDLAAGPMDQLDQVVQTLRRDPEVISHPIPHALRGLLAVRKSA